MSMLLIVIYGLYLVMVGAQGNASQLFTLITQQGKFADWIVVIAVVAVLGDIGDKKLGNLFLALILLSFFLSKSHAQTFITNFDSTLAALTGSSATTASSTSTTSTTSTAPSSSTTTSSTAASSSTTTTNTNVFTDILQAPLAALGLTTLLG